MMICKIGCAMRHVAVYGVIVALFQACASDPQKTNEPPATPDPAMIYQPFRTTLTIESTVDYPTGITATLYDDREREELASVTSADGHFQLTVPDIPVNEVYFLKLEGKRSAFGIKGLDWEERVPVYFSQRSSPMQLVGKPYNGPESVSKMRFHVSGAEVQAVLNAWQEEINAHSARIENQVAQHASLGGIQASNKGELGESLRDGLDRIGRKWIDADSTHMARLFLIYRRNDHREKLAEYQERYAQTPQRARQSKYGVDLARRIKKIHTPVDVLSLEGDSILADGGLMPLDTTRLNPFWYWVLYFWSARSPSATDGIRELEHAVAQAPQGTVVPIFVSVDEVFSRWRTASRELGLEHSYFVRKEARQALVNALYLTDLPRVVLMQPGGTVLNDDVVVSELPSLLSR